jgi:hypothetical protein
MAPHMDEGPGLKLWAQLLIIRSVQEMHGNCQMPSFGEDDKPPISSLQVAALFPHSRQLAMAF